MCKWAPGVWHHIVIYNGGKVTVFCEECMIAEVSLFGGLSSSDVVALKAVRSMYWFGRGVDYHLLHVAVERWEL